MRSRYGAPSPLSPFPLGEVKGTRKRGRDPGCDGGGGGGGGGSEFEVVGDAGDEGAEGQGGARHSAEEDAPEAGPGQLAHLYFEMGQGLGPARTPVQAGQQERLRLPASAAGSCGGLSQGSH